MWMDLEVYAEERDGWSPSHRAGVSRALLLQQGGEERVRLASGEVVTAVRGEGPGGPWRGEDGSPLDVVAVELKQVHLCGNPLHDAPQWLLAAAPFLPQLLAWARHAVSRLRS